MLRNALLPVHWSRVLIFLSSLLLACAGSPPTSAPKTPDSPVLVVPVPGLAHIWLAAPDSAYEGERLLVEIMLADRQGRRLVGIQSVRLRSNERGVRIDERVSVENRRGSAWVHGASTDEAGLYIVGRSVLEDGTYLTSVPNTIVVLPARP